MNQREKLLAIVAGGILAIFLIMTMIPRMMGSYAQRKTTITKLRSDIRAKETARDELRVNTNTLQKLREQSLCRDPDLAQSQYKTWLIKMVKEDVGLDNVVIGSGTIQKTGDLYLKHTFKVTGKGDLGQLTELLYNFYRANYLHRIRQLSVAPMAREKNQLQLIFSIDALSLQSVALDKNLSEETSDLLEQEDIKFYIDRIVQRNLFGPGNEYGPRFSRRASQTIEVNQSKAFKLSASDKDGIASYEVVKHNLPEEEATIDWDQEGNVTIMSKKAGTYVLEVRATDKGLPAKTSEITKVTISIREPAPPREVRVEPPKFDFANTAFFIASVEVGGQPEAWVKRRESGETLKLHIGDVVSIGSIKGKIVRISLKELELAEGNERLTIQAGKALSSASFSTQADGSE